MKYSRLVLLVILMCLTIPSFAVLCSDYNYAIGPFKTTNQGTTGHITLSHSWTTIFVGGVYYSGTNPAVPCTIHAYMKVQAAGGDSGSLTPWYILDHDIRITTKGGDSYSNGAAITADGEAAADVMACLFFGCGVNPSISGSGLGGGFSVSFAPGNVFQDSKYMRIAGVGPVFPTRGCLPNQCCDQVAPGGALISNPISVCGPSPIVVPLVHGVDPRRAFTDAKKACVTFDLKNDKKPACYSWPRRGSGVAFLVYDRDHDGGLVDSGDEMFGDHTPHADCGVKGNKHPTGYCALAWYDNHKQGGNEDLEITKDDKIWSQLRLWTPDHCWDNPEEACVSLPSELHTLDEYQIDSIGLAYDISPYNDKWGNSFRFYGQLNPSKDKPQSPREAAKERRSWDVFLVSR